MLKRSNKGKRIKINRINRTTAHSAIWVPLPLRAFNVVIAPYPIVREYGATLVAACYAGVTLAVTCQPSVNWAEVTLPVGSTAEFAPYRLLVQPDASVHHPGPGLMLSCRPSTVYSHPMR